MMQPGDFYRFFRRVACPIRNEALAWLDIIYEKDNKVKIRMLIEQKSTEDLIELTDEGFDCLIRLLEADLTLERDFISVRVKAPDSAVAPYTQFVAEYTTGGNVYSLQETDEDTIPSLKIQFRAGEKNRKELIQLFSDVRDFWEVNWEIERKKQRKVHQKRSKENV